MISILITGCRTGIGLEFVKQLSDFEHILVIATYKDVSTANDLLNLAEQRTNVKLLSLDVTHFDKFGEFKNQLEKIVGENGLNCIIHNAGILTVKKNGRIEDVTADDLMNQYKTNTVAPIILTKELLPLVKRAACVNSVKPISYEKAAIFFISSDLGSHKLNDKGMYWGYRESKSGLNMGMKSLHVELAQFGIGTMSLHPGWVRTKMGGPSAPVPIEESVKGMVHLIMSFNDKSNGSFKMFNSSSVPW